MHTGFVFLDEAHYQYDFLLQKSRALAGQTKLVPANFIEFTKIRAHLSKNSVILFLLGYLCLGPHFTMMQRDFEEKTTYSEENHNNDIPFTCFESFSTEVVCVDFCLPF